MRIVDRFGGSDYDSIQADNTSAFNCRDATGAMRWSEHAYGEAIDVNPIENPYVFANHTTSHPASDPSTSPSTAAESARSRPKWVPEKPGFALSP
jgi:hypothetical protein